MDLLFPLPMSRCPSMPGSFKALRDSWRDRRFCEWPIPWVQWSSCVWGIPWTQRHSCGWESPYRGEFFSLGRWFSMWTPLKPCCSRARVWNIWTDVKLLHLWPVSLAGGWGSLGVPHLSNKDRAKWMRHQCPASTDVPAHYISTLLVHIPKTPVIFPGVAWG